MKAERVFSEDIRINKYKLEEECERHAATYHYWADRLADAKTALNNAKDNTEFIFAKRELAIRAELDKGGGKYTEGMVKALLATDEDVLEAKSAERDCAKELNTLQAAVNSFDHRKSELDNLVTLLVKGFYCAPNGGKREGPNEQAEREVRASLKKKSRKEED